MTTARPQNVVLVHGDDKARAALRTRLRSDGIQVAEDDSLHLPAVGAG